MVASSDARTGRGTWYAIMGAVIIMGLVLGVGTTMFTFNAMGSAEQFGISQGMGLSGFDVPGRDTNWYFETGDYRIFYMYHTTGSRLNYTLPAVDPGIDCTVTDTDTEEIIPQYEPTTYRSYNSSFMQGIAITAFTIPRDGPYTIHCEYADGATTPQVILMQGHINKITQAGTIVGTVLPLFAGLCPMALAVAAAAILYGQSRKS